MTPSTARTCCRAPRRCDRAGRDPLALVLERAHAAGLEVHAWMNCVLVWSAPHRPRDPRHVLNVHPEWVAHLPDGRSMTRLSAAERAPAGGRGRLPEPGAAGRARLDRLDRAGDRDALPGGRHPPRLHPRARGVRRTRRRRACALRARARRRSGALRARGAVPARGARLGLGGVPAGAGHGDRARGARLARAPCGRGWRSAPRCWRTRSRPSGDTPRSGAPGCAQGLLDRVFVMCYAPRVQTVLGQMLAYRPTSSARRAWCPGIAVYNSSPRPPPRPRSRGRSSWAYRTVALYSYDSLDERSPATGTRWPASSGRACGAPTMGSR